MMTGSILHRAVQYIAAAGISHSTRAADDGHTTLIWEPDSASMVGMPLTKANGIRFALSLPQYALNCLAPDGSLIDTFPLQGATHEELVGWFQRSIAARGGDGTEYRFEFHYDLPAHGDRSPFPAPNAKELNKLAAVRSIAQRGLERALAPHDDTEPIRIWPHHFDSGALITLEREKNGTPLSTIGLGLAIPDAMVPEHYLYASPWQADGTADTTDLPRLSSGRWLSTDWKGAVVEAEGMDVEGAERFFKEATEALLAPIKH